MSAGSSTAGALADGASYYAWTWEQILATVLNIGIPDRAEVTGQPWTVIQQGGAASPGLHLIWTANGNASPNAGSTPTQVYLSPAVYAAGGAWEEDHPVGVTRDLLERLDHLRLPTAALTSLWHRGPQPCVELAAELLDDGLNALRRPGADTAGATQRRR